MKKQRFTQEEWHDLWRDESGLNGSVPDTPEDTDFVMRMLEQVELATEEPLSQQDRDRIFQRSWKWSAPHERERVSWFRWMMPLMLKPVYVFVLGVGFGVWLTVQFQQGNLDIAKDVQAEVIVENSIYKKILKGNAVQQEFPTIEDPVSVVTKSPDDQREVRRIVQGTLDNKKIVVVLNLD
jgi:hypothetical protein